MEVFGRDLIKKIQEAELLGENAHMIYSPPYRPLFSYDEILAKNPKFAAVNIVLYLKDNEWYFPLMVRSTNERDRHSGQISLPGGKREESDRTFEETAKRETSEEMGIGEHYIRIIREMSPIYIPPSNFYVRPFVSYTKKNPRFILQEAEAVEAWAQALPTLPTPSRSARSTATRTSRRSWSRTSAAWSWRWTR